MITGGIYRQRDSVPLIEVIEYKDYMSINFAGTKVCVPLKEGSPKWRCPKVEVPLYVYSRSNQRLLC